MEVSAHEKANYPDHVGFSSMLNRQSPEGHAVRPCHVCTLVSLTTRQTIASYTLVTRKIIAPHRTAVLGQAVMVPLEPFYPTGTSASQTKQSKYELPKVVQAEQINRVKEIRYMDGSISTP